MVWIFYWTCILLNPADYELVPCSGDSPLVNPGSGRDYYCGAGPDQEDCPSGSYCHWSLSFAKCCPSHNGGYGSPGEISSLLLLPLVFCLLPSSILLTMMGIARQGEISSLLLLPLVAVLRQVLSFSQWWVSLSQEKYPLDSYCHWLMGFKAIAGKACSSWRNSNSISITVCVRNCASYDSYFVINS